MAVIQDPHGDTEGALQSLAQMSAPLWQLTVPLRGQQHRDDFLRQQQSGCAGLASCPRLPGTPRRSEAVTRVSTLLPATAQHGAVSQ